jgi:hypothetical protein
VTFDSLPSRSTKVKIALGTVSPDLSPVFIPEHSFHCTSESIMAQLQFGMHVAFGIQRWHESGKVIYIMAVLA